MSDVATYRRAVTWLEADAAKRLGVPLKQARPIVAREIGVPPGTLENVRNGRSKGLRGWIERKIDEALARAIRREIARLENELTIAMARAGGSDRRAVQAALASRDALVAKLSAIDFFPLPPSSGVSGSVTRRAD